MDKQQKLYGLVTALGTVVSMGGYIGNLYSNAIATFGAGAIFILGFAIVRMMSKD